MRLTDRGNWSELPPCDNCPHRCNDGRQKSAADRPRQLQQIIAGLSEGVLLFDTEGNIDWANQAGLAAYGVETLADLGQNEAAYFERFNLHYRNHHALKESDFPIARLLAETNSAI